MDETWTTVPVRMEEYHADPAMGGAPQASADGHWWWDGSHWTPVHVPTLAEAAAHDEHPVRLHAHDATPPLAEAS